MRFLAIDVETANPDLSSICQIGMVTFENVSVIKKWQNLVNPEDYFDPWNVAIHGITEDSVKDAPKFPQVYGVIQKAILNQVVVCHTSFDRVALSRANEKYGLTEIECTWLDSAKVVRRAWPEYAYSGYGLANITEALGIEFQHHVAEEDARAAGEIVVRAIDETGMDIDDWLTRVRQPIFPERSQIAREGNPDGPLAGELVVFTGALSIPRREAAELAASSGCTVAESVNKKTTLLVVGDQDIRRLAGHDKSSKHRKAEKLIEKGHQIRILGETDFRYLIGID